MTKFRFKTLAESVTTYKGVTGNNYTIYRGRPFEVTDPKDIEYFSNKRQFEKVGMFAPKKEEPKDEDEAFEQKLAAIKGVSEKVAKKVAEIYTEAKLIEAIDSNSNLGPEIPKNQQTLIAKFYLNKTR